MGNLHPLALALVLAFPLFSGCTRKPPETAAPAEIGLYSGVKEVVQIGDSEQAVLTRIKEKPARELASASPALRQLKFTEIMNFKDAGITVSYRHGRVALIELQTPFRGSLKGKPYVFFELGSRPEGLTWDDWIVREFGTPAARAAGGRFGAAALFYSWGDISYNAMGPNQIAIYRDQDLQDYRLTHFGNSLRLFKN